MMAPVQKRTGIIARFLTWVLSPFTEDVRSRREKDAARQRRRRAKQRAENGIHHTSLDCHVTSRDVTRDTLAPSNGFPHPSFTPPIPALSGESAARARHRLPDDWEPKPAALKFAEDLVGANAAVIETEKFRDYWHAATGQKAVRTAAQWDNAYLYWMRRAPEMHGGPQRVLPLMRSLDKPPQGKIYIAPSTHEAQWEAWRKHRGGKSLPTDKAGGWWVDSEWPPQAERRAENG